jgi:hypothetical protein
MIVAHFQPEGNGVEKQPHIINMPSFLPRLIDGLSVAWYNPRRVD